jgi:hypothetical protein
VVVHAHVDPPVGGAARVSDRLHDEDAPGLLAPGITARGLPRIERRHQPLSQHTFGFLERPSHLPDDRLSRQDVSLRGVVLTLDITRPVAGARPGVRRDPALGVDDRQLPAILARIRLGQATDDLLGREALLEQGESLGSVRLVGRGLRGDGSDARLRIRHDGGGPEGTGLHGDAELFGDGVPGDDGERRDDLFALLVQDGGVGLGLDGRRGRGDQAQGQDREEDSLHDRSLRVLGGWVPPSIRILRNGLPHPQSEGRRVAPHVQEGSVVSITMTPAAAPG